MSTDLLGDDVTAYYEWAALKSPFMPRWAKQFFKAGDVSGLGGAINPIYGALVFDQINRETNAHGILKKLPWDQSGFRVTTTNPTTKGYGGADPGTVGGVVDMVPTEVSSKPGFMHTPFDLTLEAGFRANHDDGLNIWDWLVQINRDVHAQLLNEELLRSAQAEAADFTANTTDAKGGANGKGLESLDRMIASSDEEDDLGHATHTGTYDVYETDTIGDRDSGTDWDAVVVRPDGSQDVFGTNLPFQMKGIDKLIDDTEDNGAAEDSQVFLTRRDTRRAIYDEAATAGRYDLTDVQAKLSYGGLSSSATHDGRDITYTIRAYQFRPIVADKYVASNGTNDFDANGANGGTGLGHVYLLDQRFIHMKVGFPTLYVDVDNPVIRGQFDTKALFLTSEQLYSTWNRVHGKMRSIAS